MKLIRQLGFTTLAIALAVPATCSHAATIPVTGWMVHNGTSTVGGTTGAPTFTAGTNVTLMAPFSDVTLANDGEFIEGTTTLTLNTRTANLGVNSLNTQLRFALLSTTNATLTAGDFPNVGLTMEYSNLAAGGLIREQSSTTQANPFTSPVNVGNGSQDAGGDSLQGTNPGPITFTYKLTRNAGKIDIAGTIAGTDSVSGNPYSAPFSFTGWSSATFPVNATFTFNRMAVFLGTNASGTSAVLTDSQVTTIPEPASLVLAFAAAIGAATFTSRRQNRAAN